MTAPHHWGAVNRAGHPREIRLGDLLVLGGALIVFGFSFAPFVQYGGEMRRAAASEGTSSSFNAWSLEAFMVPLTTFVVAAAVLGIAAVVTRFILRRDPRALGFRLRQVEVGLALFGFLVLLGMVASDKYVFFGARRVADADPLLLTQSQMDLGWGAVLMLLGATVALAGAVLTHFSLGPAITAGATPAAPAAPPAPPPAETPAPRYQGWQQPPPPQAPGPPPAG